MLVKISCLKSIRFFERYFLIFLVFLFFLISCSNNKNQLDEQKKEITVPQPNVYGLYVDSLSQQEGVVGKNETLTDILIPHKVTYQQIREIAKIARDKWNVRKIRHGKKYIIYSSNDSIPKVEYFVYESDPINYVIVEFGDSINVIKGSKPIEVKERKAAGEITTSLYLALKKQKVSDLLALKLAEVFAWQIDFYRLYKGDKFKVIFEENFVNEEFIGIGKIIAAYFQHRGDDYYAFYFEQDGKNEYFDEEGKSLQKTFLKSPLKFSRITSGYTRRRYHPVLHRYKAHLGTDYAAPTGTPIYAVGDGVVTEARYKRNNGNYVKIRHNSTYSTQYLHMSKIAKGIRPGVKVKQKQVIGYVGSTGLATGPHVCFRFWKNGAQIDHRKQKFPSSHPVSKDNMEQYLTYMDSLKTIIDSMKVGNNSTGVTQVTTNK